MAWDPTSGVSQETYNANLARAQRNRAGYTAYQQPSPTSSQSIDQLFNTEAASQGKTVTDTTPGQLGGLTTAPPPATTNKTGLASLTDAGTMQTKATAQPAQAQPAATTQAQPASATQTGGAETKVYQPVQPSDVWAPSWGDMLAPLTGLGKDYGGYGSTPTYGTAPGTTAQNTPGSTSTYSGASNTSGLGSLYTPYTLPGDQQAMQQQRATQLGGLSGLNALAQDPTNEQRINQLSSAIYNPQAQAINQAARTQQQQMLESTFGRGTGSSSITADLAGKLAQAQDTALSNAQQNAYVAARQQANQDLGAYQNLAQSQFSAGTTGLQAEANVGLANAANQMAAGQFGANIGFQGSENALNRQQQAAQFGQGQTFTAQQNDANRALQQAMQTSGYQFTGDQAALQRAFEQNMATMGYAAQAGTQASQDLFNASMQYAQQGFAGRTLASQQGFQNEQQVENYAFQSAQQQQEQGFQSAMLGSQQNFTAMENAKNQGWQATQNEAQRQLQIMLQTMQNAQAGDEQAKAMLNSNLQAFFKGLVGIFSGINTTNTPQAG